MALQILLEGLAVLTDEQILALRRWAETVKNSAVVDVVDELISRRRAEAVGGAGAEEAFLEWLHHERGWWHGEDFPLLKEGFLAGWAARGPALTPAELRTLYDLAFGHDPTDRWDEATEALRAKLRGLVGE